MQTAALSPLVERAALETGFADLIQRLAGDYHGFYKAFPQATGHTLVGRLYGDWHNIPDGASIIVQLNDDTTLQGRFNRHAYIHEAEFRLSRSGQPEIVTLAEFAETVWQVVAGITGEAFYVTMD